METFSLRTGDLLVLTATLTFTVGNILFRKHLSDLPTEVAILFRTGMAIAVFLLLAILLAPSLLAEVGAFPLALLPTLLAFGFVSRFLNLFSFYEAIERLPVTTVSLFSSLSIVVGVLFAHWYLGEPILWYHLVGGAFILGGAFLIQFVGIHPTEEHARRHLKVHPRHHF